MRRLRLSPLSLRIRATVSSMLEPHAGEPRRVTGHGLRQTCNDHVSIADSLDFLHAMAHRQCVKVRDDAAQHVDRRVGAEPPRQGDETGDVGKHDGSVVDAVGDQRAGVGLQALDDGVGQYVAQYRVRFRLGLFGKAEGVVDRRCDEDDGGDRRLRIEGVYHRLLFGSDAALGRKPEPAENVQRQSKYDNREDQADALQAEDHERRGRGDDVLQVRAALAAEKVGEGEERGVLGADQQQSAGDLADAVGKRHHERRRHQRQIDVDHRRVGVEVRRRLLDRIEQRRRGDQVAHHVEDLQPPAHVGRIGRRSRRSEAASRAGACG